MWLQLGVDEAHRAYAILGTTTTAFACLLLFLKERLFIGEATIAVATGCVVGPHALGWFDPTLWGNTNYLIQEVSRIVLIIQIFAVLVELPLRYMRHHWRLVALVLMFGMTVGWLVVALALYLLFPRLNFAHGLLISGCITATDPVLAAAIVGKGKFGQRVPAHLRNLISAESGANDGMAFPFVLLALELVMRYGQTGEIVKEWVLVLVLYECALGSLLGCAIGYGGRVCIRFCQERQLVDRELFLVFYVLLLLMCTGFGLMLGVDDLLVLFAAGAAFAWDGWFAQQTEDLNLSNIVDLLLNLMYFVFLGAVLPWGEMHNPALDMLAWRLVVLGAVVVFLRRIPVLLALKPVVPDLRSWKEALFVGHFGPIGVGAIFCSKIALATLEEGLKDPSGENGERPFAEIPEASYTYLLEVLWPLVCYVVVVLVAIHGCSVTVFTMWLAVKQVTFTVRREGSATPDEDATSVGVASMDAVSMGAASVDAVSTAPLVSHGIPRLPLNEQGRVRRPSNVYLSDKHVVVEDAMGEVVDEFVWPQVAHEPEPWYAPVLRFFHLSDSAPHHNVNVDERSRDQAWRRLGKARLTACEVGNEIIIQTDEGEVIRRYALPAPGDVELDVLEQGRTRQPLVPTHHAVNSRTTGVSEQDLVHAVTTATQRR